MPDRLKFLIEHPTAQRLADLAGVEHDLRLVIRACDLFQSSPIVGTEEAILGSKAVGSFAILTYFRTLANGARTGVTSDQIARLPSELQAAHDRFKNVRDHYLAHSINRQEENVVEVTFKEDGISIDTLGTTHSRPGTFSHGEVASLKALAECLMQIIDEEYGQELDRVWDFVDSLSEDERQAIIRQPPAHRIGFDSHKKRRRFRG